MSNSVEGNKGGLLSLLAQFFFIELSALFLAAFYVMQAQ